MSRNGSLRHTSFMNKPLRMLLLSGLLSVSLTSQALNEIQSEYLADITAIFVFLKNDCGYKIYPNNQINNVIFLFANNNGWDLSNYNNKKMKTLSEESYRDLIHIKIPTGAKCRRLAQDSLGLLSYVN